MKDLPQHLYPKWSALEQILSNWPRALSGPTPSLSFAIPGNCLNVPFQVSTPLSPSQPWESPLEGSPGPNLINSLTMSPASQTQF